MKEMAKNNYGSIINTDSIAGEIGGKLSGAVYFALKGGVFNLTKSISKYGATYNIIVNFISPDQN